MPDVQVIGGGPAGCIAAKEAASRNLTVALFEEHESIGSRLKCSGLLSKNGLDSLGVDYKRAILNEMCGAKIYSPSLNEMVITSRHVKAFVIDRERFDSKCAEEAEECGAKLVLGNKFRKSQIKSKLLIAADGALSQAAAWFGFPRITEFAFCYQEDFRNAEIAEKNLVSIFLSNKLFPGFFGWSIPLNDSEARVGVGVFRDLQKSYPHSVKHYFDNFVNKHPIVSKTLKKARRANRLSAFIPLSQRERTAKGNILLVGDAAGQVKATTGGGIIFGGNCARIAGKIAPFLVKEGDSAEYELLWRSKFGRDLAIHYKLRKLYNSLSDRQIENYFFLSKKFGAEDFLAKHGDMDSPTAMMESAGASIPLQALLATLLGRLF